jgi:Flp pilus assembly protein TadG
MRLKQNRRSGAVVVECAVVYPIALLLLIGLIVGAMGIFRYQEMASLSRRAARYALVHGTDWAKATKNPAPATPAEIYDAAIKPYAVSLDLSKLSYSINYAHPDNEPYPYYTSNVNNVVVATQNTVIVTLTYQWIPEAFLGGITLTSTSKMPMAY